MKNKRFLTTVLALMAALSLCACGERNEGSSPSAPLPENNDPAVVDSPENSSSVTADEADGSAGGGEPADEARLLQGTWEMIFGDLEGFYITPGLYGVTCTLAVDDGLAKIAWDDGEGTWEYAGVPVDWRDGEAGGNNFQFAIEPEEDPGRGFYGWMAEDTLHLYSEEWYPDFDAGGDVYFRRAGDHSGPTLKLEQEEYVNDETKALGIRAEIETAKLMDDWHPMLGNCLEWEKEDRLAELGDMVDVLVEECEEAGEAPDFGVTCTAELKRADERFVCILYTWRYPLQWFDYRYEDAWEWREYERQESLVLDSSTGYEVPLAVLVEDEEAMVNAIIDQLEHCPDAEFFYPDWKDHVVEIGLQHGKFSWYLADDTLHVIYGDGEFLESGFGPVEVEIPMRDDDVWGGYDPTLLLN